MIFLSDTKWNGFKGQAHPITEDEIARAARELGVKWSRLHGIMEVEAAFRRPGDGFDHEGRPKMLFEPHHFYKALQIRKPSMLSVAIARDLARPSRPPMSWYGNRSYWRLVQAIELDEVSGLLACSWGFGQVLGSNWRMAGFRSVEDMVRRCMDAEAAHLQAMCGYIKSAKLVPAIVRGDAAAFARGYNGAGGVFAYAPKIAAAWRRWERIPFVAAKASADRDASPLEQTENPMPPSAQGQGLAPELPDSKAPIETKRIQGLAVAAIGVLGGAIAKKWFPASDNEFQSFLVNYGGEITAALGVIWSWIGSRTAATAIKGTPLADAISEAKESAAVASARAEEAASTTAFIDFNTLPAHALIEALPVLIDLAQRLAPLTSINLPQLPPPSDANGPHG
jgi:hypothetical protein